MKSLKRLFPYLRPYRGTLILTLFLGALLGGVSIGTAKIVKIIIDDVLIAKNEKMLLFAPLAIVGLYLFGGIVRFTHTFLLRYTGERIGTNMRKDLQKKYSYLSLSYHGENPSGSLMSKIMNDVINVQIGLHLLADVVREPINAIALTGFLFYTNWKLTLVVLAAAPILILITRNLGRSVRKYSHQMQEQNETLTGVVKETLDGIRVIKAFNLEEHMHKKFSWIADLFMATRKKILRREELVSPLQEFLASLCLSAILFFAFQQVIRGETTPGDFISFVAALGLLQGPIRKLQDAHVRFQHSVAATQRVFAVLDTPISVKEPEENGRTAVAFPTHWDNIHFKNVSFDYGDRQILKNIDLTVKRGELIAIVGSSGSGKTTLVNLLLRYFDPTAGNVEIGGIDIRDIRIKDLRSKIGLVTQEVFLFNESVKENILAGNPDDPDNVKHALKAAYASDFVERFPKKLETHVGDRGARLSGGERQRISIARAIFKDSPILVLDEATSNLDSESEEIIQKALDVLLEGRTTLVIAHRLSTIQKADRIIVISDGKIIEEGTHNELVKSSGTYQRLYDIQIKQALGTD